MSEEKSENKVLTPPFRVSFPNVFKPRAAFEGQEANYNIQMLFPKNAEDYPEQLKKFGTDLTPVKKVLKKVKEEKWGDKKVNFRYKVIKDGAEKDQLKEYQDKWYINAKSKFKPGIVNRKNEEIIDESDFYAGCWARATINIYAYDNKFGKGLSCGLQNIQFLMDDESFSGKSNAKDDFDIVDDFDDDEYSNDENFSEDEF